MGGMCDCLSKEPTVQRMTELNDMMGNTDVNHLKACMRKLLKQETPIQFGLDLFACLFTQYPYTRDWFPNFRTSPTEMYSDPHLKAHVATVMQAIQVFVDYSYDKIYLEGLIEKMALVHLDHCVTSVDMEVFWKCFLRQMKHSLGSHFTSRRERAWITFVAMHDRLYRRLEDNWLREEIAIKTTSYNLSSILKSFSL